jgi:predicted enzyme related to lactoylglutathione lyase
VDDLDAFYERVKDICALEITMKPFVRPYGWKMFRMKDPAGNHINIYEIPEA